MIIKDISRNIQDAPIYPGSLPVIVNKITDTSEGDKYNSSIITMGSHMGTHADAHSHFMTFNLSCVDQMELNRYYGKCRVLTADTGVPDASYPITKDSLSGKIEGCERIAIRSGGYGLTPEAAKYIVSHGIMTLVTDALSIGTLDNEIEIHKIIMNAGIAVIENAVLDDVDDGEYILCAFPVKIKGCDGAPVRAVLICDELF